MYEIKGRVENIIGINLLKYGGCPQVSQVSAARDEKKII